MLLQRRGTEEITHVWAAKGRRASASECRPRSRRHTISLSNIDHMQESAKSTIMTRNGQEASSWVRTARVAEVERRGGLAGLGRSKLHARRKGGETTNSRMKRRGTRLHTRSLEASISSLVAGLSCCAREEEKRGRKVSSHEGARTRAVAHVFLGFLVLMAAALAALAAACSPTRAANQPISQHREARRGPAGSGHSRLPPSSSPPRLSG